LLLGAGCEAFRQVWRADAADSAQRAHMRLLHGARWTSAMPGSATIGATQSANRLRNPRAGALRTTCRTGDRGRNESAL